VGFKGGVTSEFGTTLGFKERGALFEFEAVTIFDCRVKSL
jgi:hypothetical protein